MEKKEVMSWPEGEKGTFALATELGLSFTSTSQVRVEIVASPESWDPLFEHHNWPCTAEWTINVVGDYPYYAWGWGKWGIVGTSKILGPGEFSIFATVWSAAYISPCEYGGGIVFDIDAVPSPEPATMLLLGSGLIGLAAYGRKRFFKK